jgi:hypothetical protein
MHLKYEIKAESEFQCIYEIRKILKLKNCNDFLYQNTKLCNKVIMCEFQNIWVFIHLS